MLYSSVKLIHILSATLLLGCMIFCVSLWRKHSIHAAKTLGLQTGFVIAPLAILQVVTGFTMLSVNEEDLSQTWIKGSLIFFMTALVSWFLFIFSLRYKNQNSRFAVGSLMMCAGSILLMIFFMANKI